MPVSLAVAACVGLGVLAAAVGWRTRRMTWLAVGSLLVGVGVLVALAIAVGIGGM